MSLKIILLLVSNFFISSILLVQIMYWDLPSKEKVIDLLKLEFLKSISLIIKLALQSFKVLKVVKNPKPLPPVSLCVVTVSKPSLAKVEGSKLIPLSNIVNW